MKIGGSLSFRMFGLLSPLPDDYIERFAKNALPPIGQLKTDPISGWVTSGHLLARDINQESAIFAGFLCLSLAKAERKINKGLFAAECKMEEQAYLAGGAERISAHLRKEIRKAVHDRLLPDAQPVLKGIQMAYDPHLRTIYASCVSASQADAFQAALTQVGILTKQIEPLCFSDDLMDCSPEDFPVANYSSTAPDECVIDDVGMDFLMWIWFLSEARGGLVKLKSGDTLAIMIEGPLQFASCGNGAKTITIKDGQPLLSAATNTAVASGAKLARAKITMAIGKMAWVFTLSATDWTIRGLKLPETEKLDRESVFQERMHHLAQWKSTFIELYLSYIEERNNLAQWDTALAEIHAWATARKARM